MVRLMTIVDVVSNSMSNDTDNDREPNVAVNPSDPREIVISAFTPPPAGTTNGILFASADSGEIFIPRPTVPGNGSKDWTIAFSTRSNQLYLAILRRDTGILNIDRCASPTSLNNFTTLDATQGTTPDQPWISAITVVGGPDDGRDRLYIGFNDSVRGATVYMCLDGMAGSPTFTPIRLESRGRPNAPSVRPVVHRDGTVYAAYLSTRSGGVLQDVVVRRDDNWGNNSFRDLNDPNDRQAGRIVASITPGNTLGTQRGGNGFDIQIDPNNSSIVYICWIDNSEPSRPNVVVVRRSTNRGRDWSTDLVTINNTAISTMAVNSRGTVGLSFLQFIAASNQWEMHFRSTTTTDATVWDDTVLARTVAPTTIGVNPVGDYMRMVAVGPRFYGVFPAKNTPGPGNFFPNGGGRVRFQRNVAPSGSSLVGNDRVTAIAASVDPFLFKVEEKSVIFQLHRNPISQDEVDARRSSRTLPFRDAFRVIVDGFTANELGLRGPNDPLNVPAPIEGMTIVCTGNVPDTGSWGAQIQRFTFTYDVEFDNDNPFNFFDSSREISLNVTAGSDPMSVSASALLTLVKSPDPFILHGDPSWLSIDLRVFSVYAGQQFFSGHPWQVNNAAGCPEYIQKLIGGMTPDVFDNQLTTSQEHSRLYTSQTDGLGHEVFNFAIAKVHYIGTNPSPFDVRVFFRLFQAQTTTGQYDWSPVQPAIQPAQYRRGINGDNQPIPLAGFQGGEYVTIPFFASPRINSEIASMTTQTDRPNIQQFVPRADGTEVIKFYGCWLDFNRPTRTDSNGLVVQNNVLPIHVQPNVDGPFHNSAVTIQSLMRATHHCLIAEIDHGSIPIPLGKTPSDWDKLAQRNIAYSGAGSATAVTTFDIKPTIPPTTPAADQSPDEIIIDWGSTRTQSLAQIYLPNVQVSDILNLASRSYFPTTNLTRIDDHTLGCRVGGISYIPIPPTAAAPLPNNPDANYAGLLSIDLPDTLHKDEVFDVVVRQVTDRFGRRPVIPAIDPDPPLSDAALTDPDKLVWREVSGAFQLTIPVSKDKSALLWREVYDLAFLRHVARSIPQTSRWYLVFKRYLQVVAGRVEVFGGDPSSVRPSGTGEKVCGGEDDEEGCCGCCCGERRHCRSCKTFKGCEEWWRWEFGVQWYWYLAAAVVLAGAVGYAGGLMSVMA